MIYDYMFADRSIYPLIKHIHIQHILNVTSRSLARACLTSRAFLKKIGELLSQNVIDIHGTRNIGSKMR